MTRTISVAGYVGMMAGIIALFYSRALFLHNPVVIVLQIFGLALVLWARFTFGRRSFHVAANPTEGGLVTTGPYRYIRHPIYTGLCLIAASGAFGHFTGPSALSLALVVVSALVRIFSEEHLVRLKYPDYNSYAAQTWRMIPFVF